MVPFPAVPSWEGKLRLLLDMPLQSITLSCIAPLARPRKPVGGEIALDARSEPSAASFGLRLWKRRQMGLIRWEGRACRDRQKRTRQACPSRLQSNPFIAEAITSRREASSDSPCRALRRWRDHESRWAAKSRLMRDLNRRPGVGLQASTGPPSALRFNPSGFRRRTGHETAPPSRKFTKGLECLEGLESLVPAFYPS